MRDERAPSPRRARRSTPRSPRRRARSRPRAPRRSSPARSRRRVRVARVGADRIDERVHRRRRRERHRIDVARERARRAAHRRPRRRPEVRYTGTTIHDGSRAPSSPSGKHVARALGGHVQHARAAHVVALSQRLEQRLGDESIGRRRPPRARASSSASAVAGPTAAILRPASARASRPRDAQRFPEESRPRSGS